MFNTILALNFIIYILTLLLGFKIHKRKKDKHNKSYKKFKAPLYVVISVIFFVSEYIIIKAALIQSFLWITFILNTAFIIYFYSFTFNRTRCWKQHRMISYNFLLIPVIYSSSIVLSSPPLNYLVLIIGLYNILEFQFAKFDLKKGIFWD